MKPNSSQHPSPPPLDRASGFALVVVLAVLMLMVALAVGFLNRATTERTASAGYGASAGARALADLAVNIVQAQIKLGTTGGTNVAWASQPGMIRTYSQNGSLINVFKLYSAAGMVTNGVNLANDMPPSNWATQPAIWSDLNRPGFANGKWIYPIADPRAASGSSAVEGFSFTNAPGATVSQPLPMPVRWLYVLQDGQTVSPSGGSGNQATIPGATAANPIIGRVAFWADDESSKVNINTASEGLFWAPPIYGNNQERNLANYQPVNREFQRYQGHPAMTSLSAVFPNISRQNLMKLSPRYVYGGSGEGNQVATSALGLATDRLYSTIDEVLFSPSRQVQSFLSPDLLESRRFFLTAQSRAPEINMFNLPRIAIWPLRPVTPANETSLRTAFDRTIAFCATLKKNQPYYFQRNHYDSLTEDLKSGGGTTGFFVRNRFILGYLYNMMERPIPGVPGTETFAEKYGDDAQQILTQIYDYVRSTNLSDTSEESVTPFTPGWNNVNDPKEDHGFVVPIRYTDFEGVDTTGFGRFYTLSEMAIQFICNADRNQSDSNIAPTSRGAGWVNPSNANKTLETSTPLQANQKRVQAIIWLEMFSPMHGWTQAYPRFSVQINGLNSFAVNGTNLGFPSGANTSNPSDPNYAKLWVGDRYHIPYYLHHGRTHGGYPGARWLFMQRYLPGRGVMYSDSGLNATNCYPFVSAPITITDTNGTMSFSGGTVTVRIFHAPTPATNWSSSNLIQTITINFPGGTFPTPRLMTTGTPELSWAPDAAATDKRYWWTFHRDGAMQGYQGRIAWSMKGNQWWWNTNPGDRWNPTSASMIRDGTWDGENAGDVIRSVVPAHGDTRLIAAKTSVPSSDFIANQRNGDWSGTQRMRHNMFDNVPAWVLSGWVINWPYNASGQVGARPYLTNVPYAWDRMPDLAASATHSPEATGDFDHGLGYNIDGPYINKPDEGNIYRAETGLIPYFNNDEREADGPTFFSPNRIIPSPGMFGSLPTGVKANVPWRTLLFRPQPGHFGYDTRPRDHNILDLFWMPVVEPYAISDPFSTSGKINMNAQIMPFTYIQRETALHALLKNERISAVPATGSAATDYKIHVNNSSNDVNQYRHPINVPKTLEQFRARFNTGDIFRSATEICDIFIVPSLPGGAENIYASHEALWSAHKLTGDNARERIYTVLYPRLTTKSNVYSVHFHVQSLKKAPNSAPGTWDETRDAITGEYRGTTTIERYIDINDPSTPDYPQDLPNYIMPLGNPGQGQPNLPTLDNFYKWRVVNNRQFAP